MALPPLVSGAKPFIGHTAEFLRDPDRLVERGLAEHGTIFSVTLPGNPGVVLLGAEHARFMFAESDKLRLSIREAYPFLNHMFGGNTFWLAEHEEYVRQREILVPMFTGKHVASHFAEMDRKITAWVDALPDRGEFDLAHAFGPLILDIATTVFLGADVARRFSGLVEEFRRFEEGMDPLIPGWVPMPHLVRSHRARNRLRKITRQLLAERRTNPLPEPDFLQILAGATYSDTGEPVPDAILVNLVMILVWVGHGTTTGHLSWAVIDLLQHPGELARVRDEIGDAAELDMKTVLRMKHLDRALHESERVHPVTTATARKAMETIEYQGYVIPKGAMVVLHPGASHRLPDVFSDPDTYRPDRFQTEPKDALLGFGGGFHRCMGEHFAYTEMKVAIIRLVQQLDMRLIDTDPRAAAGHQTRWPQSPCRVSYEKKVTSRAQPDGEAQESLRR